MDTLTLPEQYSKHIETIAGYPIRVTSYRLWGTFYAKAEVALDGMGGWFATSEGSTQAGADCRYYSDLPTVTAPRIENPYAATLSWVQAIKDGRSDLAIGQSPGSGTAAPEGDV